MGINTLVFKRLRWMLCGLLVFVLVGSLGNFASAGEPPYGDTFDGITLHWIATPVPNTTAIEAMLPEFEKATGMKVILDEMDEERMHQKAVTEAAAGIYNYDIYPMRDVDILPYIERGIIQPLDPYINLPELPAPLNIEGFEPAYLDPMCRHYGKIWGMPLGSGTTCLGYREEWFKKAGMAPPKTWDELFDAAEYFTKDGRYGIVFRAAPGHHAAYAWYTTALYPFGGEQFYYETEIPIYNNPRNVESLKAFMELTKYAPPGVVEYTHEGAVTTYITDRAAMISETDHLLPWIEGPESGVAGKSGYVVIPKKYERVKTWTGVVGSIYGIAAHTKYPKAAVAFLEYFTSERNAKKGLENGAPPELISLLTDPEVLKKYPFWKIRFEAMKVSRYIHPMVSPTTEVNEIVGVHINKALVGEETAKEALDGIQEEIVRLFAQRKIWKVVK